MEVEFQTMQRVDSCALYGWRPELLPILVEGPARKVLRERVRHLPCREIEVWFCVAMMKQFFWTTKSPYYGTTQIPQILFSWLDYMRPEIMAKEDCVNITMKFDDESNPWPRPEFYITVDFDDFLAECGSLVQGYSQDFDAERQRIKTGYNPIVP